MTPLRVLQLHSKGKVTTGSVVQMLQLAEGLARRGHTSWVAAPDEDQRLAAALAAAGVHYLPLSLRSELDIPALTALRRLVARERIDVVHTHKGRAHSFALAAKWLGAPFALVVNRGVSFPLTVWNRGKYRSRHVGRIVTVCEQNRREVIASGRVPPAKVTVIYAGVDLTRFDPALVAPAAFRDELGIPQDAELVLQVGARDWKGWRELVAAFARVAPRFPRARLVIVACEDDAKRALVSGVAREHGIADRVLPVGFRYDMPQVLAAGDVVTDASWAGTGITGTLREAMAMRRAVVATRCGGNDELVADREPGQTGLLVPPRHVDALAAGLAELLGDAAARERLGSAGRQRVEQGFSAERRLERVQALYAELSQNSREAQEATTGT